LSRRGWFWQTLVAILVLLLATGVAFSKGSGTKRKPPHSDKAQDIALIKSFVGKLQGPAGPKGPQGPQGPAGPQGPQGPQGPAAPSPTINTRGVALVGLNSDGAGTVTRYFNLLGGAPTIDHSSTGDYIITLPGFTANLRTNAVFLATPDTVSADNITVNADTIGGGAQVVVLTKNAATNAFTDSGFHLVVYSAGPTG
jgi:hypothetical protein